MAKTSTSRIWFLVHSWLALPIWAFVFFICLTGSIATISQEITWLANPDVRARPPAANSVVLGYDALLAEVAKARPGAIVETVQRPVKPQFAVKVTLVYQDASSEAVYVNPYTGSIQGSAAGFDFQAFMRALHGWLLMPWTSGYSLGWYIVSAFSIPILGLAITGPVVYKKFWRGYFRPQLRIRQGARVFWGDFHRLAGIWALPFIVIVGITALWFLIQAALYDMSTSPLSATPASPVVAREEVPKSENGGPVPRISMDKAAEIVRARFPDFDIAYIEPPASTYSFMSVGGRGAYPLIIETININPYSGAIERAYRVGDRSAGDFVIESMRPLHTGDFAGIWLKLVYFLFGILLTGMVFSGMMIWTKRTAIETAKVVRGARRRRLQPLEAGE
jgi:uncharacterized iron-regulated membrane protein